MQITRVDNQVTLRQLWPEIAPQLQIMRLRCRESWLVEDVWASLVQQKASLFIGQLDGQRVGFMVTELQWEAFAVKPVLHIWAAIGPHLLDQHADAVFVFTDQLARVAGADRTRMVSPRKGWDKSSLLKWMRPVKTIWEREVSGE